MCVALLYTHAPVVKETSKAGLAVVHVEPPYPGKQWHSNPARPCVRRCAETTLCMPPPHAQQLARAAALMLAPQDGSHPGPTLPFAVHNFILVYALQPPRASWKPRRLEQRLVLLTRPFVTSLTMAQVPPCWQGVEAQASASGFRHML